MEKLRSKKYGLAGGAELPEVNNFRQKLDEKSMETSKFSKIFIDYASIFDFQKPI